MHSLWLVLVYVLSWNSIYAFSYSWRDVPSIRHGISSSLVVKLSVNAFIMVCFGVCAFLELYLCLFLFLEGCSIYKAWEKRILEHLCLLIINQILNFNL